MKYKDIMKHYKTWRIYSNDSVPYIPVMIVIRTDYTHSTRHNKSTDAPITHKCNVMHNSLYVFTYVYHNGLEDWNYLRIHPNKSVCKRKQCAFLIGHHPEREGL